MSGKLAFVFSGQGSQKVGMLAEMAAAYPVVQKTFAEASEVLGYDLWDLCQNGEQEQLNATETTQPLLLTSSVALWRVWQEKNGKLPALLAGHSLGEWSALVCANVLDFSDAVDLVRKRGAYMQTAVPKGEGSMAAVLNVDDEKILALCKEASAVGVVEAVNFNSPGQVVIAGQVAAVDKASELLKAAGAKRVLSLPVSAPFHTSLMKPAAENMAKHIAATVFRAPTIPVVHNVNAKTASDPEAIKALMIQQIDHPVLWVDCVKALVEAGAKTVVECGPGKVLCGLCTRIEKELTAFGIEDVASLEAALLAI
ncbi:MAG: ACP S-malonyltransferase [Cellvibrionales bacterium]|mgnify:FL=1|jgi:[acyl-carrier-protein] S-malonyltransferase|nr:ACP S-malonyltransferase [Cellvibrionales bacterium]MBK8675827.1 ACP S-malonyltransferase [Cellvibrionales bacterium]HRF87696.1 ACP S-malonyltransferase [Pseudomonadales bacterium]HRG50500.1 ACP S-malonyltransferase [Pseudomonadales bacterium]